MILKASTDIVFDNIFLELQDVIPGTPVYLKLEGLSITGSIKIKAALHMVNMLEASGRLKPGGRLIESSSGNLGLALSMICAVRGYSFICVSDPNVSPQTSKLIQAYGAELVVVHNRDANGGYLGTRIDLIRSMQAKDPDLIWINQYENIHNVEAHYRTTAKSIFEEFANIDYVFVGAGTTGTLGGVSRFFRDHSPATRIIAVDSVGSVTFGFESRKRHIPGLGTSRPPEIRKFSQFDDILMIREEDTVKTCQRLARKGLLLGGSSGTVLTAISHYAPHIPAGASVVAISPDMGDRYIDTVYDKAWVEERFPQPGIHLSRDALQAGRRGVPLGGPASCRLLTGADALKPARTSALPGSDGPALSG